MSEFGLELPETFPEANRANVGHLFDQVLVPLLKMDRLIGETYCGDPEYGPIGMFFNNEYPTLMGKVLALGARCKPTFASRFVQHENKLQFISQIQLGEDVKDIGQLVLSVSKASISLEMFGLGKITLNTIINEHVPLVTFENPEAEGDETSLVQMYGLNHKGELYPFAEYSKGTGKWTPYDDYGYGNTDMYLETQLRFLNPILGMIDQLDAIKHR